MAKRITVTFTESQAKSLIWAIQTFQDSYCNFGDDDADKASYQLDTYIIPQLVKVFSNA